MTRRELMALLGGAAVAWPLAARAQQPTIPVVGFLNSESFEGYAPLATAFRQGLEETGYVEGGSVVVEYRWADGRYDRLPDLVADLMRRQVAVIAANSPAALLAAKAASTTIPIVFATGYDPVAAGLVASLARPGGNLTGVTSLTAEVGPKRVELLHELVPTAKIIALLVNPSAVPYAETISGDLQAAARKLGLKFHVLHASAGGDFNSVSARLAELRVDGLVIGSDPFFNSQSEQLAALAVRHAVPAIYQYRKFAAAGGLTSYGGRLADSYRQVGIYTGRILKGEKPERAGRLLQPRHRRHHGFRADSDERQRFRTLCRYDWNRDLWPRPTHRRDPRCHGPDRRSSACDSRDRHRSLNWPVRDVSS
jgi:putative ABC transport system substrate-binding protein